jgi:hypothetical protein
MGVSLNIEVDTSVAIQDYFFYYVDFDLSSNASVTAVEVSRIIYHKYLNSELEDIYNGNYNPSYVIARSDRLRFNDNLTFQGIIDLNYQIFDNPKNSTVFYSLVYIHDIRGQDVQGYILLKYVIFWTYITSFFFVPFILYFIIHPDFREPSKEEKKEYDEFFDKIREVNREKRDETSLKS